MQDKDDQEMNSGVKIACAVLLVAIVMAAGVGLLVQHRKLDELRRAHADLEISKQILVADHAELVSANEKLAGEIRTLRDAARARATERAAVEKEREAVEQRRIAWQAKLDEAVKARAAWEQERERLKADAAAAHVAKTRAEKEVFGLKASVKDLAASEKKLRGELNKVRSERDKLRKECEALEHELNAAMQPALEEEQPPAQPAPVPTSPASAPTSVTEEELVPVTPASLQKTRTPEEHAAHEKEELKDLTDL